MHTSEPTHSRTTPSNTLSDTTNTSHFSPFPHPSLSSLPSQVMTGVTVAQAQGASFQAKFIAAIANYIGVASSAVAITGVTSSVRRLGESTTTSSSSSRALLATGVNIAYTVTAASINPTTTSTLLTNAGPVVASALASSIPTIAATSGAETGCCQAVVFVF